MPHGNLAWPLNLVFPRMYYLITWCSELYARRSRDVGAFLVCHAGREAAAATTVYAATATATAGAASVRPSFRAIICRVAVRACRRLRRPRQDSAGHWRAGGSRCHILNVGSAPRRGRADGPRLQGGSGRDEERHVDLEFSCCALDHRGRRGGCGASGSVRGCLHCPAEEEAAPAPAGASRSAAATDGVSQRYEV